MRLLRCALALLFALPGVLVVEQPASAQAPPQAGPAVQVSNEGLTVEWQTPPLQVIPLADGAARLHIPGYSTLEEPGLPRLPRSAVLVALPERSGPTLELRQLEEQEIPLPGPVEIAGRPQGVLRGPAGDIQGGAFTPQLTAGVFQAGPVELEPLGVVRGVRLARLVFYPVRPDGGKLRITTHLQVVVRYNAPGLNSLRSSTAPLDPVLASIQSAVANPGQVVPSASGPDLNRAQVEPPGVSGAIAAVEVTRAGLTAITYDGLAAAGLPVAGLNPQLLRLNRLGIDLPIEWEGNGDTVFDPGERLLFYSAPRFSRYSTADVYFLRVADGTGPGIVSRPAGPGGQPAGQVLVEVTAEQNKLYTPECYCAPVPAGRDGDRWTWSLLQQPGSSSGSYPVELSAVDSSQPARLTVWLIGKTDLSAAPDHRVELAWNGTAVGAVEWDGKQAVSQSFTLPGSSVSNGTNTLSLSIPARAGIEAESAWLDAFSVQYTSQASVTTPHLFFQGESTPHSYSLQVQGGGLLRAYDVTDPDQPVRLTGLAAAPGGALSLADPAQGGARSYWITSEEGILTPDQLRPVPPLMTAGMTGAQYLLITPAEFLPGLGSLIALRSSQGLKVAVETVEAIYAAYGDGRPDPGAIHSFLLHMYTDWDQPPTFVLLVGDGTSDPRRYNPAHSATWIPPFLAEVDPWAGETAADNRYVTLDGEDNLPEMLIGRLPVNNLAELEAVVSKIVQYELAPAGGPWNEKMILAADNPDGAGDYPAASDRIASALPPAIQAQRFYLEQDAGAPGPVRQGLLDAWYDGAGLVMFNGHASVHQWAAEILLHMNDVGALHNGPRLPVVLEMTCFTGSFQIPGSPTLDEALLRQWPGGAIAVWGPTGLGIGTGHEALATGFLNTAFGAQKVTLGQAALYGKIKLAVETPAFADLIDTYTLLGDPATALDHTSRGYSIFLPQIY